MRDWWNDAGQTQTSTVGFITEEELASCSVTAAKMASGTITACQIASCAIEAAKLGALSVLSCKLSANALTRVLVIPFSKLASTESGSLLSSTNIVYQPIVPITITGLQVFPTGAWQNATCDHLTFYRNSSACVANVGFKSVASTASLWGVASCVGVVTNAAVAANTILTMKTNVSTCSVSSNASIVVHFQTTA